MRKSFTIIEVLVSSILFAAVVAGFLSVVASVRHLNARSRQRIIATNVARQVLEDLYEAVRQDTWGSGNLTDGAHNNFLTRTINGITYTVDYNVISNPDGIRGKQVDITVRWQRQ